MTSRFNYLLIPILLATPGVILANEDKQSRNQGAGMYLGASYGSLRIDDGEFKDDDTATKLFIGGNFNPFIGAEVSYLDFGEQGGNVASANIDGYSAAVTGSLPLGSIVSLRAKGGYLFWDADIKVLDFQRNYAGEELFYGVGVRFDVARHLAIVVDYERFKVDIDRREVNLVSRNLEADLDYASVGVMATF